MRSASVASDSGSRLPSVSGSTSAQNGTYGWPTAGSGASDGCEGSHLHLYGNEGFPAVQRNRAPDSRFGLSLLATSAVRVFPNPHPRHVRLEPRHLPALPPVRTARRIHRHVITLPCPGCGIEIQRKRRLPSSKCRACADKKRLQTIATGRDTWELPPVRDISDGDIDWILAHMDWHRKQGVGPCDMTTWEGCRNVRRLRNKMGKALDEDTT